MGDSRLGIQPQPSIAKRVWRDVDDAASTSVRSKETAPSPPAGLEEGEGSRTGGSSPGSSRVRIAPRARTSQQWSRLERVRLRRRESSFALSPDHPLAKTIHPLSAERPDGSNPLAVQDEPHLFTVDTKLSEPRSLLELLLAVLIT